MTTEWVSVLQSWQEPLSFMVLLGGFLLTFRTLLGHFVDIRDFFTKLRLGRFRDAMQATQEHTDEHRFYSEAWKQEMFLLSTGIRAGPPFRQKICDLATTVDMPIMDIAVICRTRKLRMNGESLEVAPELGDLLFGIFSSLIFSIPLVFFLLVLLFASPSPGTGIFAAIQLFGVKLIASVVIGGVIGLSLRSVFRPYRIASRLKKILAQHQQEEERKS